MSTGELLEAEIHSAEKSRKGPYLDLLRSADCTICHSSLEI